MKKRFLFVPVQPTPNGRLHIGHIAGPYLKSDVLARHLRLHGHEARIVSGVDTFEAHVCLKAFQEGISPEEVNAKYYRLMLADLRALDIEFDAYIDPLSPEHVTSFAASQLALFDQLEESGALELRSERFYKRRDGRVLSGCWIRGQCPQCGSAMKAFYCEECGANLRPEEIVAPYFIPPLEEGEHLEEIEEECAYIRVDPDALAAKWRAMDLDPRFVEIARAFLAKEGNRVRMTTPDTWGVRVTHASFRETQVLYSYTTIHFYALYCAALAGSGAFAPDSDVVTVAAFGIDNTNAFLVAYLGAAAALGRKSFDYYLTNYFFQLDHKKIASSSGHAIWAEDLTTVHGYPSDVARMYLLSVNPQHGPSNFTLAELDAYYRRVYVGSLLDKVGRARTTGARDLTQPVGELARTQLRRLFESQAAALAFPTPEFANALEPLYGWLQTYSALEGTDADRADWLLGLSLLTFAVAPRLSAELRDELGLSIEQVLTRFGLRDAPRVAN